MEKELEEIKKTICEQNECISQYIFIIFKQKQILKLKNTVNEFKNSLERFNSRLKGTEERISKLE